MPILNIHHTYLPVAVFLHKPWLLGHSRPQTTQHLGWQSCPLCMPVCMMHRPGPTWRHCSWMKWIGTWQSRPGRSWTQFELSGSGREELFINGTLFTTNKVFQKCFKVLLQQFADNPEKDFELTTFTVRSKAVSSNSTFAMYAWDADVASAEGQSSVRHKVANASPKKSS